MQWELVEWDRRAWEVARVMVSQVWAAAVQVDFVLVPWVAGER